MPLKWISTLPKIIDILPDVLDRLPLGIHIEDRNLRSVYINEEFVNIFGYTIDQIASPDDWWPLVYPDAAYRHLVKRNWFAAVAAAKQQNTEIVPQEWRVTCRDRTQKMVQFHCRAVGDYHVHAYVDVTTRHKLDAELRELANTDPLTGVANRRRFFAFAEAHLSARAPASVLLIDIDHFKSVNDRLGHAAGDQVLVATAAVLRTALAGLGILARWGGEEFAVFLPDYTDETAAIIAEKMRGCLGMAPISVEGHGLPITVSIGGSSRQTDMTGIDAMLRRADRALYLAKNTGRDRVVFA